MNACTFYPHHYPPLMILYVFATSWTRNSSLGWGQAHNVLCAIHKQLCITSTIIKFERGQHYASQHLTQIMKNIMENFYAKMPLVAMCYQAAFKALSDLDCDGERSQCFKLLDLSSDLYLP